MKRSASTRIGSAWIAGPWAAALGGLLLAVAAPVGVAIAQESDLSGRWVLDYDESDVPREVFDALSERRRGSSGVGVGVGIFGVPVEVGRSGGRGNEPAEVVRRDLRRLPPHIVDAVDQLDVEQVQNDLHVGYANRGAFVYHAGESHDDGEEITSAEWRRDVFTVVRQIGDDLRVTEELYLDRRDASRLRWLVSVELSSARTVQIRRVFDRAPQP